MGCLLLMDLDDVIGSGLIFCSFDNESCCFLWLGAADICFVTLMLAWDCICVGAFFSFASFVMVVLDFVKITLDAKFFESTAKSTTGSGGGSKRLDLSKTTILPSPVGMTLPQLVENHR